jgi:hypothetical protein
MMLTTVAALAVATPASAAKITVTKCGANCHTVLLDGDIIPGDADRFKEAIYKNSAFRAVVVLNSAGGSLLDGLDIGEFVKEKGFATFVRSGDKCASACAYIWVAGSTQYFPKEGKASIGFHGSYMARTNKEGTLDQNSKPSADPGGNAIIGAYLHQLGFNFKTISAFASPAPTEMLWLTTEKQANDYGFRYKYHSTAGSYEDMVASN